MVKSSVAVKGFEEQLTSIFGSTVCTYNSQTNVKSVVCEEEGFTLVMSVFATTSDSGGYIDINQGRPDIPFSIDKFISSSHVENDSYECCLLLCGPKSLVGAASTYGMKKGIHCHTETFNY